MQSLFGFGANSSVDIVLSNVSNRAFVQGTSADGGVAPQYYIFTTGEDISGDVKVTVQGGKKLEHTGVKVELKGVVESFVDKQSYEFVSSVLELCGPGAITGIQSYHFKFGRTELPHETYSGMHARVRYYLRAVVGKSGYGGSAASKELDVIVQNPLPAGPDKGGSLKLEVGIEDVLHLEFEYDRAAYHLADIVTGRIDFLLVRIKIKHMEVAVIRREQVGAPPTMTGAATSASAPATTGGAGGATIESETLTRFEVMDGSPVRGERIPVRLHLSGLELSPTMNNVANSLTVRYFLNLVLVDDDERRYFKQQEIFLWRKAIKAK